VAVVSEMVAVVSEMVALALAVVTNKGLLLKHYSKL
jgi:hypothetical protein